MSDRRTAAFLVLLVYYWTPLKGVPKKSGTIGPVALTSLVTKAMERIVKNYRTGTDSLMDPLQFARRTAERSASCPLSSSCVLPCSFDPGPEVVIHWLKPPEDRVFSVHSFYHSSDQLGRQTPLYKDRTALFKEEIAKGNASLRITGIELADGGRYKCYTSTTRGNNEDFINVDVYAPVSDVSLSEDGQKLKCDSGNIYPKPSVSWTPPSDAETEVKSSESGVWSVLSSVSLPHSPPHEYSCNVSTPHSWRSATYRTGDPVSVSGQSSVSCSDSNRPIKALKWTFNRTQTILDQTGPDLVYHEDWKTRAELGPGSALVLKNLNKNHQGLYSCFLKTDDHFYLTTTKVTVTEPQQADHTNVIVGVLVTVFVALLVVAGFFLYRCLRKRQKNTKASSSAHANSRENEVRLIPRGAESNGAHK